jgi:hypothetical protein
MRRGDGVTALTWAIPKNAPLTWLLEVAAHFADPAREARGAAPGPPPVKSHIIVVIIISIHSGLGGGICDQAR